MPAWGSPGPSALPATSRTERRRVPDSPQPQPRAGPGVAGTTARCSHPCLTLPCTLLCPGSPSCSTRCCERDAAEVTPLPQRRHRDAPCFGFSPCLPSSWSRWLALLPLRPPGTLPQGPSPGDPCPGEEGIAVLRVCPSKEARVLAASQPHHCCSLLSLPPPAAGPGSEPSLQPQDRKALCPGWGPSPLVLPGWGSEAVDDGSGSSA